MSCDEPDDLVTIQVSRKDVEVCVGDAALRGHAEEACRLSAALPPRPYEPDEEAVRAAIKVFGWINSEVHLSHMRHRLRGLHSQGWELTRVQ